MFWVTLGWDINGKEVRKFRRNKGDALALAKRAIETADMIERGIDSTVATAQQSYEFLTAKEILKPFNVSVVTAAQHYADWHQGVKHIVTVAEARERWGKWHDPEKGEEPKSITYVNSMMNSYLKPFSKIEGHRNLIDLKKEDFEKYIRIAKKNINAQQKEETKRKLITWLNWCKLRDFYPADAEPLKDLSFGNLTGQAKENSGNEVLDPKVIESMLNYSVSTGKSRDVQTGIVIAIRAFVGLRTRESRMLRYRVMRDIKENLFRIDKSDHYKTFPRNIELKTNASDWLQYLMRQFKEEPSEGQYIVWDRSNPSKPITDGAWKQHWTCWIKKWNTWAAENGRAHREKISPNSIRNTFASSAMKVFGVEYVLECMGQKNFATLQNNYLHYLTEERAKALFAIRTPEAIDNEEREILAVHEAVASIEKEHGIDRDDFPDWDFSNICFYDLLEIGEIQVEVCKHYPSDYIAPFMDWHEPDEIMDGDAAVDRHKKRVDNLSDGDKAIWEACLEWRKRQAKEIKG